jgi:spermidine/putrescine transport system substrate-binding protein
MDKMAYRRLSRRHVLGGAGAALGVTLLPWGAHAEEAKLNVYNWDTYIGEATLDTFTFATGVAVQYDLFASNEELFAKLQAGNPGYDVIMPSDYMIESMIAVDMLMALDHARLPNLRHLDPDPNFSDPAFNPGNKFAVPYLWGTMGIGYRKSAGPRPDSWADVFESDAFAGRIALLDDPRAMIGMALKYLGHSMNSTDAAEIAAARDVIIAAKPRIKTFAPDSGQDMLLAGDVDLAVEWSGDIVQVMAEDADLDYVIPREGGGVWMDTVAIPKGAPHPENAHAFINHLYDPAVNAEIASVTQYPTPNLAAKALIDPADRDNPAIYPPAEVIATSEALVDVGDAARLYDEAWTAIQAA